MALSDEKIREATMRLLKSRMRILCNHGFYGLLLMHMKFSVDEKLPTAATDGIRITFGMEFLSKLSDTELDFVMMHEVLHVVLKHCMRGQNYDQEIFNIACDIVVNSNILLENKMDLKSITLKEYGESMHKAPDGKEGHIYTAEQVYQMLMAGGDSAGEVIEKSEEKGKGKGQGRGSEKNEEGGESGEESKKEGEGGNGSAKRSNAEEVSRDGLGSCLVEEKTSDRWDDHSKWGQQKDNQLLEDIWKKHLRDALESIRIKDPSNSRGLIPLFAERFLEELGKPQIDWRTILNDFIQEEIVDYSFMPPDRRFDESPFFLPDFNEKDDKVEKILFVIDTSGSMSDKAITAAYSEIKGAIDQFNGRLSGWLGFFDAELIEPKPFENEDEFRIIKPKGGGGTDFDVVFSYLKDKTEDELPVSIIILTDGYAPFPDEKEALGIPVLWLINNDEVEPPWGKVARMKV